MPPIPAPSCPRCGYDQTGSVETWTEACPLDGICSECGLTLDWRRVLNPVYGQPRWFAENLLRPLWRTWPTTAARALRPSQFWLDVRMEYPVQAGRLRSFAIAAGTIALLPACVDFLSGIFLGNSFRIWPYYFLRDWSWYRFPPVAPSALFASVWLVTVPFAYLLLTDTLRQSRVRTAHLWRGLAYALIGLASVILLASALYVTNELASPWARRLIPRQTYGWVFLGLVCWLLVFWYAFTDRYLRLPSAGLTAALMFTVSGLFAAIVAVTGYLLHIS